MKPLWAIAAAFVTALAAVGCGAAQTTTPRAPARGPAPAPIAGGRCRSGLAGVLRAEGVGCSAAERVTRRFLAEARSPQTVLTVEEFVCEERGATVFCSRGTARVEYEPPR